MLTAIIIFLKCSQKLTTFGERQNGTNFVAIAVGCHQFQCLELASSWSKGDKVSKGDKGDDRIGDI